VSGPPGFDPALWERIRSAQDRALAAGGPAAESERAVVTRLARLAAAPRPRGRVLAAALSAGALAAVLVVALLRPPRQPVVRAPEAPTLVAEAGSELPLRFPGGSTITFLPGSSGQVQRLSQGAEVEVRGGRLEAHVVHAPGVRWVVRAGPFRVHVTGTRFGVDWSPGRGELAVTLREGSVVVDGGVLGAGVPLRAGQRLRVDRDGVVRTEAIEGPAIEAVPPPAGAPPAVAAEAVPAAAARPAADWRALADRGAYREALRAAERGGLEGQLQALDARGLLALGDVARYAGAPGTAMRTFERLVARFPHHRLAADAVFSLGRLSFEAGQPDRAASWFARYVRRWPDGPLAEQAAGRLVESWARAGDVEAARRAARDYLRRSPQGTYAGLARSIAQAEGAP
jgi:hypothetical protein